MFVGVAKKGKPRLQVRRARLRAKTGGLGDVFNHPIESIQPSNILSSKAIDRGALTSEHCPIPGCSLLSGIYISPRQRRAAEPTSPIEHRCVDSCRADPIVESRGIREARSARRKSGQAERFARRTLTV